MTPDDVSTALQLVLPSVRADLEALVRIPSVSADPARLDDVHRCAEAVAHLLRNAGLPDVQILSVDGGLPAVVGRRPAADGAPTVCLYAHHDVQPTGARSDWDTEPFEATEVDGRLYGRGAADDKAGIGVHLAAVRALGDDVRVGLTLLIEGEEEIGSPTLDAFIDRYRDLLAADVFVLADSTNRAIGEPALTTSLRGLVNCFVEVGTIEHGVHSGMYGGAVPDALTALCRLLATLHDDAGSVAIAGLHDASGSAVEMTEDELRTQAQVLPGVDLIGTGSLADRLWNKPALTVLAIDSPRVDDASNTLQPRARAKVSLRIPPGQDAAAAMAALVDHLEAHAPWGAQVTVTPGSIGSAYRIEASGPVYDAARRAFATAWGTPSVDMGCGGTIPFVASFAEAFPSAAILVTGVEDPASRAHGANESLHVAEWQRACLAEALLLNELGSSATAATEHDPRLN
jgi:acetylornithine deacetylase/succinyl-diaminopimelate desuccinylase-like protein